MSSSSAATSIFEFQIAGTIKNVVVVEKLRSLNRCLSRTDRYAIVPYKVVPTTAELSERSGFSGKLLPIGGDAGG